LKRATGISDDLEEGNLFVELQVSSWPQAVTEGSEPRAERRESAPMTVWLRRRKPYAFSAFWSFG
jgi:hypothetical protein